MGLKRGGLRSSIRNLSQVAAIPDSVVYQYLIDEGAGQTLADSVGGSDISLNFSNWVQDADYEGGYKLDSDGVDDTGTADTMGDFGSNMDSDFAIGLQVAWSHTSREGILGVLNDSDDTLLALMVSNDAYGSNDGVSIELRDDGSSLGVVESSNAYNDGSRHTVLFNKTGQNPSDVEVYVDGPDNDESNVSKDNGSWGSFSDFEFDMKYFARNKRGSESNFADIELGLVEWFDNSLTLEERQDWFNNRT